MAVEAARIRRIRRWSGAGQLFWSGPRRRPNAWYVAVPGTRWPAHSLPRNWSAGLRRGDRCFCRRSSGGLKPTVRQHVLNAGASVLTRWCRSRRIDCRHQTAVEALRRALEQAYVIGIGNRPVAPGCSHVCRTGARSVSCSHARLPPSAADLLDLTHREQQVTRVAEVAAAIAGGQPLAPRRPSVSAPAWRSGMAA